MRNTALFVLVLTCSTATLGVENRKLDSKGPGPTAMCSAAAAKLRESHTSEVVLIMIVDTQGRVQSFSTQSPKGLRLEKVKEAAAAIKAIQFEPAKLNGQPVKVRILVTFDCSKSAADSMSP